MLRACALVLVFVPASAAGVLVVDDQAGGGQFTSIQAAIDAAQPGDVVLLHDGEYETFKIAGKGVHLVAEKLHGPRVPSFRVQSVPAGQQAILRGIHMSSTESAIVWNCAGSVRLEDCYVSGQSLAENAGTVLTIDSSADVVITRCFIGGGKALGSAFGGQPASHGSDALHVLAGSRVALFDTQVQGGHGGDDGYDDPGPAGNGGRGLVCDDSTVFYSGIAMQLSGGALDGGDGGQDSAYASPFCQGGDGGAAVTVSGPNGRVRLLEATLGSALPGNLYFPWGGAGAGAYGPPSILCCGGMLEQVAGLSRHFSIDSPVGHDLQTTLRFKGVGGDAVGILVSLKPGYVEAPNASGALLVAAPFTFVPVSNIVWNAVDVPLTVPSSPALHSLAIHLQSTFLPAGGAGQLGPASVLAIL